MRSSVSSGVPCPLGVAVPASSIPAVAAESSWMPSFLCRTRWALCRHGGSNCSGSHSLSRAIWQVQSRQILNNEHALQRAREPHPQEGAPTKLPCLQQEGLSLRLGVDWLLHVDSDELLRTFLKLLASNSCCHCIRIITSWILGHFGTDHVFHVF